MNTAIYIPSLNRAQKAKSLVRRLKGFFPDLPIFVCIDYEQDYSEVNCKKIILSELGKGIGYSRKACGDHAIKNGFEYMIMLDDDSVVPENLLKLVTNLEEHPEIAWCGGYVSFYGIMGLKPNTGLYYTYSMGCSIMAVNTKYLAEVGGFDAQFRAKEDDQVKMKLMDAGYYISIDTNVCCSHINTRGAAGGCSSYDMNAADKEAGQLFREYWGEPYFSERKGRTMILWGKMNKSNIFKEINLSELPREAKPMITVTAKDIPKNLMTGKTLLAYPIPWSVAAELGEKYESIHYFDKMTKGLFFDEDSSVVTLENSMKVIATKKFSLMVFNEIPTQGRIEALSESLEQNGVMLMPAPRSGKPATFAKMMKKINLKKSKEHTNDLFDAWVRA